MAYVKRPQCPECMRKFKTNLLLGSHRRWVHGVAGSSTNSKAAKAKRKPIRARDPEQVTLGARVRRKLERQEDRPQVKLADAIGVLEHEVATMQRTIDLLKSML